MPTVTNKNFFNPIQAEFHIRRLPNVNFFCQKVTIPGMAMTAIHTPSPFTKVKQPGDAIEFDELVVTFKVDEYLTNYLEVAEWMLRLGFPEDFSQYRKLGTSRWTGDGPTSDGAVLFLDSKSNPKLQCDFVDLFPISISSVTMDSTMTDVEYLTATVTFAYTLYNISTLVTVDA